MLDTLSFIFLTPLIVGTRKLVRLLLWLERSHNWVRTDFFANGSVSIASMAGTTAAIVLTLALLWRGQPTGSVLGVVLPLVGVMAPTLLALSILPLYRLVADLVVRHGVERALAIIGASMFFLARLITITWASVRIVAP
ncbi:hypothetical protein ACFQX4_26710 [Roseomonas sp. GCM10028921]